MKADAVLSKWHFVRTPQSLSRSPVPPEMWTRLKQLVSVRDAKAGKQFDAYETGEAGVRAGRWSEREFEDGVVIPILERLGWQIGTTLKRQHDVWIKVGSDRPKNVFADIVGFRDKLSSEVVLVVETKRKIKTDAELKSAREQAMSYAGKLHCPRFVVAAPEGIWVYSLGVPWQCDLLAHVRSPSPASQGIDTELALLAHDQLTSTV